MANASLDLGVRHGAHNARLLHSSPSLFMPFVLPSSSTLFLRRYPSLHRSSSSQLPLSCVCPCFQVGHFYPPSLTSQLLLHASTSLPHSTTTFFWNLLNASSSMSHSDLGPSAQSLRHVFLPSSVAILHASPSECGYHRFGYIILSSIPWLHTNPVPYVRFFVCHYFVMLVPFSYDPFLQ